MLTAHKLCADFVQDLEDNMATSQMDDIIAASEHAEKKASRISLGMYLIYFLLLAAVALALR